MDSTYKSKMTTYVNEQIPKLKTVTNDDLESMFENFSPDQIVERSRGFIQVVTNNRITYRAIFRDLQTGRQNV